MMTLLLKIVIEVKRKQMIKTALRYGLTHQKTVRHSTKLDIWLNHLRKLNSAKEL